MSGAEVGAVLGLISSIIAIIETSREIYDAATSARGLHEAFRAVAQNIPLVLSILRDCRRIQERADRDYATSIDAHYKQELEQTAHAVKPILVTCEGNARKLNEIFAKVVPGNDAGWLERYRNAARAVMPGKKSKVEDLIKEILEKLQLLHTQQFFKSELRRTEDIQTALDQIEELPPSLPDDDPRFLHMGSGPMNVNAGTGRQQNYNISGGTNGKMYNAETMNFGKE